MTSKRLKKGDIVQCVDVSRRYIIFANQLEANQLYKVWDTGRVGKKYFIRIQRLDGKSVVGTFSATRFKKIEGKLLKVLFK